MLNRYVKLLIVTGLLLWQTQAHAEYFAKVNAIWVSAEGEAQVFTTVLNTFAEAPEPRELDRVEVFFGEGNGFSGDDLTIQPFSESGIGTDYVLVLPGYDGFGPRNCIAAARGAAWFQNNVVGGEDSVLVLSYGDGVAPFAAADELVALYQEADGLARVARPYMLSALEEAVRYFNETDLGRRRIVILVGEGYDVRLDDATMVDLGAEATDWDYETAETAVLRDHERIIERYLDALESVDARVYAVGFNDRREDYLEVLRVIARKSGGTFRRVHNVGGLAGAGDASNGVFGRIGDEINRELVLTPSITLEGGREYEVWVNLRFPDDSDYQILSDIVTPLFLLPVPEFQTTVNLIPYLIAVGVIMVVAVFLLLFLIVILKKTKKQREEVAERKKLEEQAAQGSKYCGVCFRLQQEEWTECLYCVSGYPPLEEKPEELQAAEEAQKKLNELDGDPDAEVALGVQQEQALEEAPPAIPMGPAGAAFQTPQEPQGQQIQIRTYDQAQAYEQQGKPSNWGFKNEDE